MLIVVLGTASALLYGVSDFFGGFASRTQPAVRVALVAFIVSAVAIVPALGIGDPVWSWRAALAGAAAGVLGSFGTWLFYAALALGPVGIVAPAVALMAAVIPALWAIARGEGVTPLTGAALVVVLVAGLLIGVERQADLRPSRRAVGLIVLAGLTYGSYLIVMNLSPNDSGAIPMVADIVAGTAVLLVVAAIGRARAVVKAPRPTAVGWWLMAATGVTQGLASVFLVFGLHLPGLAVISALAALYPVGTVVLGVLVLRERIRPLQAGGIALAVAGVALLALARA